MMIYKSIYAYLKRDRYKINLKKNLKIYKTFSFLQYQRERDFRINEVGWW